MGPGNLQAGHHTNIPVVSGSSGGKPADSRNTNLEDVHWHRASIFRASHLEKVRPGMISGTIQYLLRHSHKKAATPYSFTSKYASRLLPL